MSDLFNTTSGEETETEEVQFTELDMLKQRARMMGITFSNNIGVDALKARIQEKLDGDAKEQEQAAEQQAEEAEEVAAKPETKMQIRARLKKEQMKLVRIRVTCLDPKKKNLPGEIFTIANSYLGTVRKFVPFGEQTDNGYHVPYCIYNMMKDRKFLQIKTRKSKRGTNEVQANWVREFALEVLPQLDEKGLADLKAQQAASGSTSGE
ncbi:hypothetical protein HYP99_gp072 [Sinorhizobium phage ort11]|uniref:Uncharacterized protein n=1 Tax=Sinorhizobium phage ort11 TaxID=2599764 RepID=A0A5C2H242_9CAUD|nr:hypothetical protein HYP99_gp072 [Sinorhizobium phage ort11]QEP29870.1 hypothetical protein Smphiort11_072 [Sinorhizobium phage ort11]